jgi:hypothetical protein
MLHGPGHKVCWRGRSAYQLCPLLIVQVNFISLISISVLLNLAVVLVSLFVSHMEESMHRSFLATKHRQHNLLAAEYNFFADILQ